MTIKRISWFPSAGLLAACLLFAAAYFPAGVTPRAAAADTVTVTVYFGPQQKATHEKTVAFEKGDTALGATLRAARVETNAGRTFVQSIEGVGNHQERKEYWLYFVNGEAMHVGAAETPLRPGDRVLWFLRRQGTAAHVHEK
jgi:hypothetical protein